MPWTPHARVADESPLKGRLPDPQPTVFEHHYADKVDVKVDGPPAWVLDYCKKFLADHQALVPRVVDIRSDGGRALLRRNKEKTDDLPG